MHADLSNLEHIAFELIYVRVMMTCSGRPVYIYKQP
jgi:hypothetical protein